MIMEATGVRKASGSVQAVWRFRPYSRAPRQCDYQHDSQRDYQRD